MYGQFPPTQQMGSLSLNEQPGSGVSSQQWPSTLPQPGLHHSLPTNSYNPSSTYMQPLSSSKTGGMIPSNQLTSRGIVTGPSPESHNSMMPGPPGSNTMVPRPSGSNVMAPGPPAANSMTNRPPGSNPTFLGHPSSNSMPPLSNNMMSGPPIANSMMTGPPPSNPMMQPVLTQDAGPPNSGQRNPPASSSMMTGPNSMMAGSYGSMGPDGPPTRTGGPPGSSGMMSAPSGSEGMMTGLPPSSNPYGSMVGPDGTSGLPTRPVAPLGSTGMMSSNPYESMVGPGGTSGPPTRPGGPPGSSGPMMSSNPYGSMVGPGGTSGPPTRSGGHPGIISAPPRSEGMTGSPYSIAGPYGTSGPPTSHTMSGPPGSLGMMSGTPGPGGMMHGPPGPGIRHPGSGGMMSGPHGGMSAGPIQSQPVRQAPQRIDPDMMPNPIAVKRENQEKFGNQVYMTSQATPPPLVTTSFSVQDNGSCSPRYMRSTLYTVPSTKDLLNQCRIPLGVIIQPFANVPLTENSLCLVDHGVNGPIRCNRCKAYMNPHCRFVDGGRQYICPICQCSNEVPQEYFSHMDHTGRRMDIMQRPELLYGTVEYAATKDYCKEGILPNPVAYIFIIDVSVANLQSGLVNLLTQTIASILDNLPRESNEVSPVKVGFVTYDRILHFYNIKETLGQPQMMVVSDVSDVFVPLVDGFLVDASETRSVIENLMAQIPDMFSENRTSEVMFEPAVRAGLEALKAAKCNGRLFVFHSNLPTCPAPGQLKNRLDSKLLGTDKEKTLINPVGSYTKLIEECVKYGVGVDLFLFPISYTDVATLGHLATNTGGQIHYYPNFQTHTDGERLISDLKKSVSRPTGFDAVMRVRCSTGIRAVNFYGGFYMSNTTDIEFGNIDSEKAIAVEIKHDDTMKEDIPAYIQVALLYTTISGQRRLRIHSLALNCSSKFSDIYHSCELDTLMCFFSKSIASASLTMPYKTIRENFSNQCAVILACYRKNCSQQSPPGQLILPDSLKLLPMYANCLLKSDALLSPPIVSMDEKCFQIYHVLSMNLLQSMIYLYPRMVSLNPPDISESSIMRCTGQKMKDDGIYLIENGLYMALWIGQHVPNELITKIFGVASYSQIDSSMTALPALDNEVSYKLRASLAKVQGPHQMKLLVAKQRDKSEVTFRRMLKEDKGSGPWEGSSYIDYLCQLHKEIREQL